MSWSLVYCLVFEPACLSLILMGLLLAGSNLEQQVKRLQARVLALEVAQNREVRPDRGYTDDELGFLSRMGLLVVLSSEVPTGEIHLLNADGTREVIKTRG